MVNEATGLTATYTCIKKCVCFLKQKLIISAPKPLRNAEEVSLDLAHVNNCKVKCVPVYKIQKSWTVLHITPIF